MAMSAKNRLAAAAFEANALEGAFLQCQCCGQTKPRSVYSPSELKRKKTLPRCRACLGVAKEKWRLANPERITANRRARYAQGYKKRYDLRKRYGMTLEQYEDIMRRQGRKCACCGVGENEAKLGKLYVDHCHDTGVIRGIICQKCNAGIGLLGDSVHGVRLAVAYLDRGARMFDAGIGAGLLF